MNRKVNSLAKISRPRLYGVIPRKRLFKLLDQHADRPVLWLFAPPGAGKTALLGSYADSERIPTIWYQMDAGDADLASFFHYLGLASPESKRAQDLPHLTPEYLLDLDGFCRRFFREFFARLKPGTLLVLDNYQELSAQALLHRILALCIQEAPAGIRLAIVSRAGPPEAFARLLANRQLALVEWGALKFTYEEVFALATHTTNRPTSEALRALHEQSNGWAAGIVLMLERLHGVGTVSRIAWDDALQPVFDYFADLLFNQLSPENQAILLRCAYLPKISVRAAISMSGSAQAEKLLEYLYRRHLFTDRREASSESDARNEGGTELSYEFHALFRAFLLNRTLSVFGPQQQQELILFAAQQCEVAGALTEAVDLYGRAQAFDALAAMILNQAPILLSQGRNQTLDAWFARLPDAPIASDGWLMFWKGASRIAFNPPESRQLLAVAYELFSAADNAVGQLLACSAVLEAFAFEQDNFALVDPWIDRLETLLREYSSLITPELEGRLISSGVAILIRATGHPLVHDLANRAGRLIHETDDPDQCMRAAWFMALYLLWRARYPETRQLIVEVNKKLKGSAPAPLWRCSWHQWQGVSSYCAGHATTALEHVESGLKLAQESNVRLLDFFQYSLGSHTSMSIGDLELARRYIERIESVINPHQRIHVALLAFEKATFASFVGDANEALRQAAEGLELFRSVGAPNHQSIQKIALAEALIDLGRFDEAERYLNEVHQWGRELDTRGAWVHIPAYIRNARMDLLCGDHNAAKVHCGELFRQMREADVFAIHPAWRPKDMAQLCEFALDHEIEVPFVKRLIRLRSLRPANLDVSRWPWPIKIHGFGELRVFREEQRIAAIGKTQKRPLDLLRVVVAFGARNVDAKLVTDVVWPESTQDAEAALHTTLHRLRKLLGSEDAIILARGKLSIDLVRIWCDVALFDELTAHLESTPREHNEIGRLTQAMRLYRGDLCGQDFMHPAIVARREHYKNRFRLLIKVLGEHFEFTGDHRMALTTYTRAIELDSLSERHYQRLMACHYTLGEFAEGIHVYRRCRETLSLVLSAQVSAETEAIHQQLRARMG